MTSPSETWLASASSASADREAARSSSSLISSRDFAIPLVPAALHAALHTYPHALSAEIYKSWYGQQWYSEALGHVLHTGDQGT